jgi:hypothetical protein
MAFKDPEQQRLYLAEYYRKNRERIVRDRLARRDKNLAQARARDEKNNAERRQSKRPRGIHARPELHVTPKRGWHLLEGFLYFSTRKGFTLDDVEAILAAAKKLAQPTKP